MKLTETLKQDIADYEHASGRIVRPELLPLLETLAAAGDHFEEMGAKDHAGGYAQRSKDAFIEWGKRELIDPVGKDHPIVELMYTCYIDGYNMAKQEKGTLCLLG